jgi:hypothetical protein
MEVRPRRRPRSAGHSTPLLSLAATLGKAPAAAAVGTRRDRKDGARLVYPGRALSAFNPRETPWTTSISSAC